MALDEVEGSVPPELIRPELDKIPGELRSVDRWIVWNGVWRPQKQKYDKVPVHPTKGYKINHLDPKNHLTISDAWAAYSDGMGSGIGFVMTGEPIATADNGDPLYPVGVDFDNLTSSREATEYARSVYKRLGCYMEVSPSGTGLRMFALSRTTPRSGQTSKGEMYTSGRFLTVTGHNARGYLREATNEICEIEREFWPAQPKKSAPMALSIPTKVNGINHVLMGRAWHEEPEAIAKIRLALSHIPANSPYEVWRDVNWAIASLGWSCGRQIAEEWSATSADHWHSDGGIAAQQAIAQLFDDYAPDRGITVGTLLYHAYQHGMPRPEPQPKAPFLAAQGTISNEETKRFSLLSRAELDALTPLRWLVRSVLPETGLAAIYGEPGSGKSYLAIDIAAHVSTGLSSWFGRPVARRDVVYAALEGGRGMQQRQAAWDHVNGCRADRVRFLLDSFTLFDETQVTQFIEVVTEACEIGSVVIIDTLAQATPGADENSAKDMGLVLQAASAIAKAISGLVILVHHSGKEASRGLRGHSSLNGAMDAVIAVERDRQTNRRSWRVTKMKDGDDGASGQFQLEVVDLGPDGFGGRITSCAVREITASSATTPTLSPSPKGVHQQAVYDALKAQPDSVKGWTRKTMLDVAKKALTDIGSQHRATRAKEAIDGLIDAKIIKLDEGGIFSLTLFPPDHPPPAPL